MRKNGKKKNNKEKRMKRIKIVDGKKNGEVGKGGRRKKEIGYIGKMIEKERKEKMVNKIEKKRRIVRREISIGGKIERIIENGDRSKMNEGKRIKDVIIEGMVKIRKLGRGLCRGKKKLKKDLWIGGKNKRKSEKMSEKRNEKEKKEGKWKIDNELRKRNKWGKNGRRVKEDGNWKRNVIKEILKNEMVEREEEMREKENDKKVI